MNDLLASLINVYNSVAVDHISEALAFDTVTVNHQILHKKIEKYGIRGIPLKWFTSYLFKVTPLK